MPEKDNTGMGERIQSMVEDAVASMDFEQLNRNITGSIQSVFEELNIQMPQGTGQKGSRASNVRYHYGTEKLSLIHIYITHFTKVFRPHILQCLF